MGFAPFAVVNSELFTSRNVLKRNYELVGPALILYVQPAGVAASNAGVFGWLRSMGAQELQQ